MNTSNQPSTYIVGYYGMKNTGDDALMTAAIHGARTTLNTPNINISSPIDVKLNTGEKLNGYLHGKQKFPGQNRLSHYARAIDSKQVIFGGGSVFHNAHDIDMKRDMMMFSGGRNHLALGVGLGPFKNTRAEKSCAKFLNTCGFTGLRDPQSFEIAKAIAPNANTALTFDLAPQLTALDGFNLVEMERQGIAVCLCPLERLNDNHEQETRRLKLIAMSLDHIHALTGEKITFIDFNGHEQLGDAQVHQEVASFMSEKTRHSFVSYDANPLRVLQRIAAFKAVIGMRLHASVFAFITETPLISLNYHSKCEQWCEQIGLAAKYQFNLKHFDAFELIQVVSNGITRGFARPSLSAQEALNLSMKNWSTHH